MHEILCTTTQKQASSYLDIAVVESKAQKNRIFYKTMSTKKTNSNLPLHTIEAGKCDKGSGNCICLAFSLPLLLHLSKLSMLFPGLTTGIPTKGPCSKR